MAASGINMSHMTTKTSEGPQKSQDTKKRKEPPQYSNKRGHNGKDSDSSVRDKRVRIHEARDIATQRSDSALNDQGELDLQAFLNAREFEINSFEESMRLSKTASARRAFQQVPRNMRRRTASHNVKRVPKRLQARAIREKIQDNTPTVTSRRRKPRTTRARIRADTARRLGVLAEKKRKRQSKAAEKRKEQGERNEEPSTKVTIQSRPARPKIRRNQLNEPPKPTSKFRKRQINKTWLPTHMWHAKRARMTEPRNPLWRFAIPLTPNEKIYRLTYRASGDRGTLAWDTSYISTIGLYGSETGVERVLRSLGVTEESCWNEKGRKWRMGSRHWTGWLSKTTMSSKRELCPVTILWNPESSVTQNSESHATEPKKAQRQVFIRVHPAAFLLVFNELVKLVKMQTPRLYVEDLRFEIGSIELLGPASTETLFGILRPYYDGPESRESHASMFEAIQGVTNPSSLPANSVLAFSVVDPRMRYPPRSVEAPTDEASQLKTLDMLAQWPAEEGLKQFALFCRNARFNASQLPSQQSLNRRRGDARPGTYLSATAADPPIPIILLASRVSPDIQDQGTWTILAPWKCILPIWYSLVHYPMSNGGNPRIAGLNELRQVAFERGQPCFPFDYVASDAGAEWEMVERARRKADWEKRPKGKRVTWSSLDLGAGRKGEIGAGWACDFELLFGLTGEVDNEDSKNHPEVDAMDVDNGNAGPETALPQRKCSRKLLLSSLNYVPKDTYNSVLNGAVDLQTLLPRAILTVRIILLSRGSVSTCARIYRLPSPPSAEPPSPKVEVPATQPQRLSSKGYLPADLREQWLSQLSNISDGKKRSGHPPKRMPANADMQTRKRLLVESLTAAPLPFPPLPPNQTDVAGHPLAPDAKDLIGFVTTGAFCLSEGRGTAIGTVSAEKILGDLLTIRKAEATLCIVRNAGENVGWLARWEVVAQP